MSKDGVSRDSCYARNTESGCKVDVMSLCLQCEQPDIVT